MFVDKAHGNSYLSFLLSIFNLTNINESGYFHEWYFSDVALTKSRFSLSSKPVTG